ncbi:MAG TPA: YfiR family protein [Thermoanaerobaculia bacterium]|nr:YfiR family protein [Thermoanaerobaculia bacterium]
MSSETRTGRLVLPIVLAVLLVALPAHTADRSLEYAVKATFLYKFASFVEWPQGSFDRDSSPFYLCVAGADPYGGRIQEAVSGQSVGRHPIVLRQLAKAEPQSDCHVMFVSGSASQRTAEALKAVSGTATLTVTDSAISATAGIVHFVIVDDRVSFDIDNVAAAGNRLVISSKLLALARKVNAARPEISP